MKSNVANGYIAINLRFLQDELCPHLTGEMTTLNWE
jgi:hypothetical protein